MKTVTLHRSAFALAIAAAIAVGPVAAVASPGGHQLDGTSVTAVPQAAGATASSVKSGNMKAKKPTTLETVIVTGSLIPAPRLQSDAAVQVIHRQDITLSGVSNVDKLLTQVPSAFTTSSANSDSEDAFSTVGLRGFGANRTLVLIDGTRVVPGDPTAFNTGNTDNNGTNLNFIPAPLVKSVQVLTGGASATYGSDAIAGVVNFIMRQHFSGFTFDGQWTQSGYGDGTTYTPTVIWGANSADGKGNVTLYASYLHRDSVNTDTRPYTLCPTLPNATATGRVCLNSSSDLVGEFTSLDRPVGDNMAQVAQDGSRMFVPIGGAGYSFTGSSYLQRPEQRYNFGGFAHQNFNKHFELFGSAMFMKDQNTNLLPPSTTNFNEFNINCANPLMSAQQQAFLCPNPGQTQAHVEIGRRLVGLGDRTDVVDNTEYRLQLGIKGAITDGWHYNITGTRSQNQSNLTFYNFYSKERFEQGLQVGESDNGNPVCTNQSDGCVPINLFQYNAISPEADNYIRAVGLENGTTTETVTTGTVNGDLGRYGIRSPFAIRAVQMAAGLQYRRDSLNFLPDPGIQSGDTTSEGGAVPAVTGSFNAGSIFTEFKVPVIQGRPFVDDLSFDLAYRLSRYRIATRSSDIYTHTYRLGMRYSPDSDVALRASWNRAVRVPDIQELFFPDSVTPNAVGDPCSGQSPSGTVAQCENTGVTPQQYGHIPQCPQLQCNVLVGGNLNLKPESSITRQLGLVLTPNFFKGFTGTVDYYDILLTGAIGAIPGISVLGTCEQQGKFCDLIHRGPNGELFGNPSESFIAATAVNTGFMRTRGYDVSLQYDRSLSELGLGDDGRIMADFNGTYVSDFQQRNTPESQEYNCAGLYGLVCGDPHPRWRSQMRLTWENPMGHLPGLAVSLQWRYIGSVSLDANRTANLQLNPAGASFDAIDNKLSAINYFDVASTYQLPINGPRMTLRFGINNVTSRKPPVVTFAALPTAAVFGAPSGTFASLYDTLGRVYFAGIDIHLN